jgi:hypothetical protein
MSALGPAYPQQQTFPDSVGTVDIQIIGRKPHAPTGPDGWIAFQNKAIRELSDLPYHASLRSLQSR